jgi:GNAT superfamily N-acetyltransferase
MRGSVPLLRVEEGKAYSLKPMRPEWIEMCLEVYRSAYGLTPETFRPLEVAIRQSIHLEDRLKCWVVAFEGDALVASCFASHHRERFFIEEFAVAESHRGRGLGQRLITQTVSLLAEQFPKVDSILLDVDRLNLPAISLYAKLGFAPVEHYTISRRTSS